MNPVKVGNLTIAEINYMTAWLIAKLAEDDGNVIEAYTLVHQMQLWLLIDTCENNQFSWTFPPGH